MPTIISGTEGITTSSVREGVFTLTGTSVALDLTNGAIQLHTLTGNSTYTDALQSGEAITLMIDDGAGFAVTWPTIIWVNTPSSIAPALSTTGFTIISVWKVGTTLYGALVGRG
jgi:hypothetical protein